MKMKIKWLVLFGLCFLALKSYSQMLSNRIESTSDRFRSELVVFSADDQYFAISDSYATNIFEASTGRRLRSFPITSANQGNGLFSPTNNFFARKTTSHLSVWNLDSGEEIIQIHHRTGKAYGGLIWLGDNKLLLKTEKEIVELDFVNSMNNQFYPMKGEIIYSFLNNKYLVIQDNELSKIWSLDSKKTIYELTNAKDFVFSKNGRYVVFSQNERAVVVDMITKENTLITDSLSKNTFFYFSPDESLLTIIKPDSVQQWSTKKRNTIWNMPLKRAFMFGNPYYYSPNGEKLLLPTEDSITIVNPNDKNEVLFSVAYSSVSRFLFDPNNQWLYLSNEFRTDTIDLIEYKIKADTQLTTQDGIIFSRSSNTGRYLSVGDNPKRWKALKIYDSKHKTFHTIKDDLDNHFVGFIDDEIVQYKDGKIIRWSTTTGKPTKSFNSITEVNEKILNRLKDSITTRQYNYLFTSKDYLQNGRQKDFASDDNDEYLAVATLDGIISLWNLYEEKKIASLYAADKDTWFVITPEGKYDASEKGLELLYYSNGKHTISIPKEDDNYVKGLLFRLLK